MNLGGAWRPVATAVLASVVLAGGSMVPGPLAPARAASAFARFGGYWSGSGHARLENGRREAIRCRASYVSRRGGAGLGLSLRCATPSGSIELRAKLDARGRRVSGTWEERSYGLTGRVSGAAAGNSLRLRFRGGLSGAMNITTSGRSQSISVRTDASTLRGVSVRLRRRN